MKRIMAIAFALGLLVMALPLTSAADEQPPVSDCGDRAADDFFCNRMLFAQAGDPPMGGHGPGPGRGGHRGDFERQRKHLEQLRMLKMLELLDLDEGQEVEFLTRFNRMRDRQKEIDQQMERLIDTLGGEIESGAAQDARLNQLVDRAVSLQNDKHRIMQEFMKDSRSMLTPTQVGKLLVFHERFESELLERLGRFREGRFERQGKMNNPGGPNPPIPDEG